MIKLLIGGSPCTHWSIAQKKNRETGASGEGWELFQNYLMARDKFKPDLFLYENVASAPRAIKEQISSELGVSLMQINSALVSAQNRQRIYGCNWATPQPQDRRILLTDILESGICDREKAYTLKHQQGNARDYLKKHHTQVAFEPVLPVNAITDGKSQCLRAAYYKDDMKNPIGNNVGHKTCVERPMCIGEVESRPQYGRCTPQQYRVYSPHGKSVTLCGKGGWIGAKTGLYSCPMDTDVLNKTPIYEVNNGEIIYNEGAYKINLPNGLYIIRKLSVTECCRLQTLPDNYCRAVSATQAYKGLGNGWTAEVIIHLLNHGLARIPRNEPIIVISIYDGIGTGRYCLDKLGFSNVRYYAYEINKYAMQISASNYPDIIQCGDAFQVRAYAKQYASCAVKPRENAACRRHTSSTTARTQTV